MRSRQLAGAAVFLLSGLLIGFLLGRRYPQSQTPQPPRKELESWTAAFTTPASIQLPEKQPVVRFDFSKPKRIIFSEALSVTVTNLTDESYLLSYIIYGYEQKGKRIAQGRDRFAIGKRESVIREVLVQPYAYLTLVQKPASYGLAVTGEKLGRQ